MIDENTHTSATRLNGVSCIYKPEEGVPCRQGAHNNKLVQPDCDSGSQNTA